MSDLSSPHGAWQEFYDAESHNSDSDSDNGDGSSIHSGPADSMMRLGNKYTISRASPSIPRMRDH